MPDSKRGTDHKIIIRSYDGTKLAQFTNYLTLSYSQKVNGVGVLELALPEGHINSTEIALNNRVEVYRQNIAMGLPWTLDFVGLMRWWEYKYTDHLYCTARCYSLMWLLQKQIVAWYANTANRTAFVDANAETIAKTLVSYNLGSSATTGNGRLLDGTLTGFTVEADATRGNELDWYSAWDNLLETLQELSDVGGGDFNVVRTAAASEEFRWYAGQLGTDRTATVKFALERGNMENPTLTFDYTDQVTKAVVCGKGEDSARATSIRTSADYSSSNHVERYVDASGTEAAGLPDKGDQAMAEHAFQRTFAFDARQTPSSFYGLHYFLGDLCTAQWLGMSYTVKVDAATIARNTDGSEEVKVELAVQGQ